MKKITTIFVRNPESRKGILPEHHPDCEWVFAGEGIATRKYDGTCYKVEPDLTNTEDQTEDQTHRNHKNLASNIQ